MKDFVFSQAKLRHPDKVMRLSRMGAMFPSRLSFIRSLTRQLIADRSMVSRPHWNIDKDGFGTAVYTLTLGGYAYSLFCITKSLEPGMRTDRVIAEAWDAAFVLYDGVPDASEIERLSQNAPLQEAGGFTKKDLCLSRANKSVRLFDQIVASLRSGTDLPMGMIQNIGYLMRTTAVYGNGKFGIADRREIEARPGLQGPFMAEMLTVWLIRTFTHDLVEHVGGNQLPDTVKRQLGIGNSTGLGMAPFLVSHPLLLHSWMVCRETALARVRVAEVDLEIAAQLITLSRRVAQHLLEWNVPDPMHQARIVKLRREWVNLTLGLTIESLMKGSALDCLIIESELGSQDLQELTVSWMLEPFGDLVDGLAACMANPHEPALEPAMSCDVLRKILVEQCGYATEVDFTSPFSCEQFWYVSEAKLEPRIGKRHTELGADRESPLDISRQIHTLAQDLQGHSGAIWQFLAKFPGHRLAVQRVQTLVRNPYSEIRDNLVDGDMAPIDMLRCKLSFFGASKFDPKSQLWTRITLAQGAPLASDLAAGTARDDWWLPVSAP
tara:strand:- start:1126 stop:2778 length:1653 start_codon:yes stop_codon:yes gene_type:complete